MVFMQNADAVQGRKRRAFSYVNEMLILTSIDNFLIHKLLDFIEKTWTSDMKGNLSVVAFIVRLKWMSLDAFNLILKFPRKVRVTS